VPNLKKLALGRKGFAKPGEAGPKGVGKTPTPSKKAASKGSAKTTPPSKPSKSLEESCKEEIGELEAAFRNRIAKEEKRVAAAMDSEIWFCVYFRSREECNRFLRDHGLDRIGDKYLDGRMVNRILRMRSGMIARDAHTTRR
jgi:hypothetical protein